MLCKTTIPAEDAKFVNERIRQNYAVNLLVDGLPGAEMKQDDRSGVVFYSKGFALGDSEGYSPVLYNHYNFYIEQASFPLFLTRHY
jgi:transmembrane 9 superfamily protein 2/4